MTTPTDPLMNTLSAMLPSVPRVGQLLPELVVEPTTVQLFQFSAVSWIAHRIHYDREYAREEGYPDVLVQSHLHGCFMLRAVRQAIDGQARVERFGWRNRGIAVPGDRLTCSGSITAVDDDRYDVDIEERNQCGELCATGHATVLIQGGST